MTRALTLALLATLPLVAGCAPPAPPPGPMGDAILTGFAPGPEFTAVVGTNGSFEEVQALINQPRASMRAYTVSSSTERNDILAGLGLEMGPTATVRDAGGRVYNIVGTSAGTFLFDISSFFDG